MAINDKNFMGLDGFVWWFGVVENRQDPLGIGRVQARIYGWHTDSLADIPSENLPWATVVHAVNDRAFATPREDDIVFGFFADGRSGQFPVVMGIVPGYFTKAPNTGTGFNDLRSQDTLKLAPKHPIGRDYNTDGSGIVVHEANTGSNTVLESFRHPNADELDQASITGVARYENLANTVIQARKNNLDKNILSAGGFQWSEPYPAYNPLYPYNQANETESGHVFELDDTPGFERVHFAHRSGTFQEIYPTGTMVEKITKSKYQIIMADDYLHVMGKVAITVDADCLIRVKGDVILEGGGKLTANVAGDIDLSSGGAFNVKAKSANFDISGDYAAIAGSIHLTGPTDINGDHVNLQSSGDLNIKAGGAGNIEGSTVNMKADGLAAMQGGIVGISGTVLINGLVSVNKGAPGASGASGADTGSAAGIGEAIGALTKNSGEAPPEEVPVPLPGPFLPDFDPVTGTAFKHQQFLNTSANNTLVAPDSNTANIPTMNCSFDPSSHDFISDSSSWAISDAGLNIIRQSENFAKVVSADTVTAYPDPVTGGEPLTIGYGSTAPAIGQPVTLGELMSRATAEGFLEDSINTNFLPTLRQTITVPLTQNMIDACLSLIYNIGTGNFTKSTLRKRINASAWCDAGDAFLMWNKADGKVISGLTTRRKSERTLFLT
jgi:lysozyme